MAMYAALLSLRWSKRPVWTVVGLVAFLFGYLRFKQKQLKLVSGYFHARHLYSNQDYWIHPWGLFCRTFSLCRSDGEIVETISTSQIAENKIFSPVNFSNISPNPTAVRKMMWSNRGVLFDAAASLSISALFWIYCILKIYRRYKINKAV
jgi:hypothetical protein